MRFFCFFFFFICYGVLFSQEQQIKIYGKILSENKEGVSDAYVYLKNSSFYTISDADGNFELKITPGKYEFFVSKLGYEEVSQSFDIQQEKEINFTLTPDEGMTLDNVYLNVKSKLNQVKESSFNVVALNTENFHNSSLDISETLDKVSGVRVRRTGGTGSDYNVMLNGFSGRHVKFFINGMPMEGFNAAFQLNNIPVNLAKRIEVYKGVVPISFGADALGGAVNIVTSDGGRQNFLDASYSFGSFNTHKTFINAAYTARSGFTARFNAFQNYSDNNYKVDADILDLENYQFTGEVRKIRRFHDRYKNYSFGGQIGFVNTTFANELLVGFTFSDVYDEIQHPAYMKIAFGEKYTTSKSFMPNFIYRKRNLFIDNLDLSVSANYNYGQSKNIDDSYRRYNWLGEYIITDSPGEFRYSKNHFKDQNTSINTNLSYSLKEKHLFSFNNVLNNFWRKNNDEAEPKPEDQFPTETLKDIVALGYQFKPDEKFSISAFSKYYFNRVKSFADPTSSGNFQHISKTTTDLGYGAAASYFLLDNLQIKSSFEKAYRVPTGRELFGAANDFDLGNPDLKSESSQNLNMGVSYSLKVAPKHQINLEGSFIYRDIRDFIRMVPDPNNGVLKPGNEAKVKNYGWDMSLVYVFDQLFSWETNFTYQDLRNYLKYRSGKDVVSTIYKDRMPNIPYLYANSNLNFYFKDVFEKQDHLSVGYDIQYIHKFDYSYESYGGRKIPTQFVHDLLATYSFGAGRYNISLSARNIFDKNLYDNFSLQKPGRNFSVKFRYFLNQF